MKFYLQLLSNIKLKRFCIGFFGFLALMFAGVSGMSQFNGRNIHVKYITEPIYLDGVLDETVWQAANKLDYFWQFFPTDTAKSINPTQIMILYDDHSIYVGVRAEVKSNNYVVTSLRRDFVSTSSDNVTLMFDTFRDGTTACLFG